MFKNLLVFLFIVTGQISASTELHIELTKRENIQMWRLVTKTKSTNETQATTSSDICQFLANAYFLENYNTQKLLQFICYKETSDTTPVDDLLRSKELDPLKTHLFYSGHLGTYQNAPERPKKRKEAVHSQCVNRSIFNISNQTFMRVTTYLSLLGENKPVPKKNIAIWPVQLNNWKQIDIADLTRYEDIKNYIVNNYIIDADALKKDNSDSLASEINTIFKTVFSLGSIKNCQYIIKDGKYRLHITIDCIKAIGNTQFTFKKSTYSIPEKTNYALFIVEIVVREGCFTVNPITLYPVEEPLQQTES